MKYGEKTTERGMQYSIGEATLISIIPHILKYWKNDKKILEDNPVIFSGFIFVDKKCF